MVLKRLRFFVPGIICYTLVLVTMLWLMHFAPFYAPSYFFWIGFILALLGLISFIKPWRFLFIFNRKIAAIVCISGFILSATSLLWPVPLLRPTGSHCGIDVFMPEYSFREYHEVLIKASPEHVMQLMFQVSLSDMPAARVLMRLRALVGKENGEHQNPILEQKSLLDLMASPGSGFLVLDNSRTNEFIGGMVGKPWTSELSPQITTAKQFMSFHDPGNVKVSFNFLAQDVGNSQTLLSTETRICGNDANTCRIFGRYWRIIYPGSAIIRRVWLDVIADQAEKP